MSRSIGNVLPDDLFALLDGGRLDERIGLTILLLTCGEDGWPSVALLSVGEVVAPTPTTIRLALWPGTTTTGNLARTGKGTLAVFGEGRADYIQVAAERRADLPAGGMDHAYFESTVADILRDEVRYARMTSGVTFELPDPPAVLARWRATVDAMLAAPGTDEDRAGRP
jgi:hypothetical protein